MFSVSSVTWQAVFFLGSMHDPAGPANYREPQQHAKRANAALGYTTFHDHIRLSQVVSLVYAHTAD